MALGASEEDLISAITESLEQNGKLNELKAKIRTEILDVLNTRTNDVDKNKRPLMKDDVLIINELIREYLEWMEYKCTSSMLVAEAGMTDSSVTREVLTKKLNIIEQGNSVKVPLLVGVLSTFKNMNSSTEEK